MDHIQPQSSEQNVALEREQEHQIILNEITRQEREYGESSLKVVLDSFFLAIKALNESGKLSADIPFHHRGEKYTFGYLISPEAEGLFSVHLSITHSELEPSVPGNVADYWLNVSKTDEYVYFFNGYVDREKRQPQPFGITSADRMNQIVFPGAGRALMMLRDYLVRDVCARMPSLSKKSLAKSEVVDHSYNPDIPNSDYRTHPTFRTSQIFQQMGYFFEKPLETAKDQSPVWVKMLQLR